MKNLPLNTLLLIAMLAALPVGVDAQAVTVSNPSSVEATIPKGLLMRQVADDMRARARLPKSSQPVPLGMSDPVLAKHSTARKSLTLQKSEAQFSVWSSTNRAQAGQTVDFFAEIEVPSLSNAAMTDVIRANGERAGAKYYAEVVTNAGTVLGKFLYSDDGRGADAKANDGIFSARWQLPVQHKPALGKSTSLTVKTTAVLANDELREAFDGIQYSHPGAALTGRFRDLVRDGNLVVQAEVNIVKPGRYFLEGALAYPGGESISTAQVAKSFSSAGNYWMDLSYYGLIFHDRRASGRLQLASVTLTDVNELESILGPVLTNVHLTQALNKAKLTRQSFNDPEMLEKASRIEASLAKRQHSTE